MNKIQATQSLLLVPSSRPDPSETTKGITATANSLGVHDTFRYGLQTIEDEVLPKHPLENRLAKWDETQRNLRLTMERRVYGLHAPVRQLMELHIVSGAGRLPMLPSSNLGLEILTGRDETIDFEDFLDDPAMATDMVDVHAVMEHHLGIKP